MKKNNLKKSFLWNTLGNSINSFNSLFFLIIVTRINGIKDAGIFTFAFATTAMLYSIALYFGRTFQVTETKKKISDKEFIIHRFISSFFMMIIALIFCLIKCYNSSKFVVFLLLTSFRFLEAISDIYHGILQKNDKLDISGKILFFRCLLNLILFVVIDYIFNNIIFSCISLVISNIIVLIAFEIPFAKKFKDGCKHIEQKNIFYLFKIGFYTFGITFIANYLVNAPRYSIDSLMDEKYQTIFGIIVMPATIILLLNQFILQPVIIILKDYYLKNEKKSFLNLIYKIITATIFIGVISLIVAYFLGIPVLNIIYKINLSKYLPDLLLIIIGATLYAISGVISQSLIVLRKTKIQLLIYLVSLIVAFINSHIMVRFIGFRGATYSYLLTMFVLLIMYITYLTIVVNKNANW